MKLSSLGVSEPDVKNVLDALKSDDLFQFCNTGTLNQIKGEKHILKMSSDMLNQCLCILARMNGEKNVFFSMCQLKKLHFSSVTQ